MIHPETLFQNFPAVFGNKKSLQIFPAISISNCLFMTDLYLSIFLEYDCELSRISFALNIFIANLIKFACALYVNESISVEQENVCSCVRYQTLRGNKINPETSFQYFK